MVSGTVWIIVLNTAFKNPDNYYYPYTKGKREDAFKMARKVWDEVDLPNLNDYILPNAQPC